MSARHAKKPYSFNLRLWFKRDSVGELTSTVISTEVVLITNLLKPKLDLYNILRMYVKSVTHYSVR